MFDEEEGSPQRELLEVHLGTIHEPLASEPALTALYELLYTASETGLIDDVGRHDAIRIWKIVTLAQTIDPETLDKMRM